MLAGRIMLGSSMVAFGVLDLIHGKLVGGLPPLPAWISTGQAPAYLMGVVLLALGALLLVGIQLRLTSIVLGSVFFLGACLHLLRFHDVLTNGNARTGALEPFALCGALWAGLAVMGHAQDSLDRSLSLLGRGLFAGSMLIFGVQHFLYLAFLTLLIPKWLLFPRFWVLFTGVTFVSAALAIGFRIADRLAGLLLAAMFFGWVCVLHAPRIAAHLTNSDEWCSGLVALAFTGGSLWIAASARSRMAKSQAI